MIKFATEIRIGRSKVTVGLEDRICVLGSCFSDGIGAHLADAGFEVCVNPFGTLYNPKSILAAMSRLDSGKPYTEQDCVRMGAGADMICSFEHHSSFAREDVRGFLENANAELARSSAFWAASNKVIVTLGTAYVWNRDGKTVSNCLKRPAAEFGRELLGVAEVEGLLAEMVDSHPDKEFIFTVSPVRHLSDGAHANTISKATLQLGVQKVTEKPSAAYFPAYEILMDELRDYRFYAADLVHPRDIAVGHIWDRFLAACLKEGDEAGVRAGEKASRHARHRTLLHK